jgi:acetyl-CoA carboxylase beta subunit
VTCNCTVCSDHRRWMAAINPQTDEAKAALDEILSRLEAAETDRAVADSKLQGIWPGWENVWPKCPSCKGNIYFNHECSGMETEAGPTAEEMKQFDQYIATVSERRIEEATRENGVIPGELSRFKCPTCERVFATAEVRSYHMDECVGAL